MLYEIVNRFPQDMIPKENGPFVSLYQPTHRYFPDNRQDPIVFKNLLRTIETSLKLNTSNDLFDSIMKPFYELLEDKDFWNNTTDGIAVYANQNKCIVYKLQTPVKEFAVVANSFHIKPLLQAFQSVESYQILGLSRENFKLYQGNRFGVQEIILDADTPRTMQEVLEDSSSESYLSQRSASGVNGPMMYHGQSDTKSKIDKDTEKYFRYVDALVHEKFSKLSKLPLILVALTEYHSEFRTISNNPFLLNEGIKKSSESLDLEEIQSEVRNIIETINLENTRKLIESYGNASANALGSSDLIQVVKAAFESRVEMILIEENRIVPGKIDLKTGKIKFGDLDRPDLDDVIDDLAELVLSYGGNVFILPKDRMPTTTGVAAIFRYH